jgi:hypothetical protein
MSSEGGVGGLTVAGLGIRGRRERVDVVTMSESDSLESDSSSVLFRLCVSSGAGVSVGALSAGSKSEPSASSKGEELMKVAKERWCGGLKTERE